MEESEAALVVGKIVGYDRRMRPRDRDEMAVMVAQWHEGLSDLLLADCLAAVAAFYRSGEGDGWIMVKHVRDRVQEVRLARLRAAGPLDIPSWIANGYPRECAALVPAIRAAVMDGRDPAPVIEAAAAALRSKELAPGDR